MKHASFPGLSALLLGAFLASPAGAEDPAHPHHPAADAAGHPGAATPTAAHGRGAVVVGQYLEARTCDVWTGPCFANGEINLRGDQAVLGWHVERGVWNGVQLDGRKLVAVVDAQGTLTTEVEGRVETVVFLEEAATEAEQSALLSMVRELAPRYFEHIVKVERRKIELSVTAGEAALSVEAREGTLEGVEARALGEQSSPSTALLANARTPLFEVRLRTAPLSTHCDTICGNESSFYPALSRLDHKECAKTVENAYSGPMLQGRWSDPNKRSAIVGEFSL